MNYSIFPTSTKLGFLHIPHIYKIWITQYFPDLQNLYYFIFPTSAKLGLPQTPNIYKTGALLSGAI